MSDHLNLTAQHRWLRIKSQPNVGCSRIFSWFHTFLTPLTRSGALTRSAESTISQLVLFPLGLGGETTARDVSELTDLLRNSRFFWKFSFEVVSGRFSVEASQLLKSSSSSSLSMLLLAAALDVVGWMLFVLFVDLVVVLGFTGVSWLLSVRSRRLHLIFFFSVTIESLINERKNYVLQNIDNYFSIRELKNQKYINSFGEKILRGKLWLDSDQPILINLSLF